MSAATGQAAAGAASPAERRARLRADVAVAGRILTPAWPIDTFIAVNPLGGLEDRPFEDAIRLAGEVLGARGTLLEPAFRAAHAAGRITAADLRAALDRRVPAALRAAPVVVGGRRVTPVELLVADLLHGTPVAPPVRRALTLAERIAPAVADVVDEHTAKWCGAFLDAGQAAWPMPGRDRGCYAAWRDLAPHDRALPRAVRAELRDLPAHAEDAILAALEGLGVDDDAHRAYLRAHLARLPGWAAHVRWRGEHGEGIDLVAHLALRLVLEEALLRDAGALPAPVSAAPVPAAPAAPSAHERARHVAALLGVADGGPAGAAALAAAADVLEHLRAEDRPLVWLDAYEGHLRDGLLAELSGRPHRAPAGRPAAQVVCCIDTRSEGLRRHLEEAGPYETFGFAGFFAVAMSFQDLAEGRANASCPVLVRPRGAVRETPASGASGSAARRLAGLTALAGAQEGFHAAKDDLAAPFALAEAAGWAAGPLAAARTLWPGRYGQVRERAARRAAPPAPTDLTVREGFPAEERALLAEVALRTMGLTGPFARIVLLCGHGSSTENNPYEAALHCGACGGNRGGPNARAAAQLLNDPEVRPHLAGQGIAIPPDTWFVAAEHDTATDAVTVLDEHLVPEGHREELRALAADLAEAGARLSAERCATLPGAPRATAPAAAARHVRARATDWAQVFPEWGLAGNAFFVVGPRELTRGVDLRRRAFLHSYEAAVDPDGAALETILTAPLVVAQWINCQYYFSTVEPDVFGSGTKTIHNVVGGIGVLAGHGGDLRLGLPWQSVAVGERLVHEPVRLLAVVQAPLERIEAIVARNRVLRDLFDHDWVALAARHRPEDPWQRRTPSGFVPWTREEAAR